MNERIKCRFAIHEKLKLAQVKASSKQNAIEKILKLTFNLFMPKTIFKWKFHEDFMRAKSFN